MPTATGAAVACPDRRVVCLQADGGGMYTLQALWTQAREKLDVTTVIFANRKYAILQLEFGRVGAHNRLIGEIWRYKRLSDLVQLSCWVTGSQSWQASNRRRVFHCCCAA